MGCVRSARVRCRRVMVTLMQTSPERPYLVRWTGPMRRVKKHLQAQGWQVNRAGWAFQPFHLLAVHPTEGVKLLWVYATRGPDPDLSALAAFPCDPAWVKELWRYPATWGPRIRRVEPQGRSATGQPGACEASP